MKNEPITLIFYRVDRRMGGNESLLNLLAAVATRSDYAHVEIAIGGGQPDASGRMTNVLRVFNDRQGVELAARSGSNPMFSYMSLWCSDQQRNDMLSFARNQVGKPFSQLGMFRTLLWPRRTHMHNWFCAELTAAALQAGGFIDPGYNPGSATPESLHRALGQVCATGANPFVLNNIASTHTTGVRRVEAAPRLWGLKAKAGAPAHERAQSNDTPTPQQGTSSRRSIRDAVKYAHVIPRSQQWIGLECGPMRAV